MGEYTLELRDVMRLCDIEALALSDYPIWSEGHRKTLNGKILDHYYYHEIAHETADQFIRRLRTRMREIMPYYCEYAKTLPDADIMLTDMDMGSTSETTAHGESGSDSRTTRTETSAQTTSQATGTTSKSRAVNSETPQARLAGHADYATSAADTASSGDSKSTGSQDTRNSGDDKSVVAAQSDDRSSSKTATKGRGRPAAELIAGWRAVIANVDMMVVDELAPLFLQVWGLDSDFTGKYPTYW